MSPARSWIGRLLLLVAPSSRESGQTLAEYSLVLALVALVSAMAVTVIGLSVNGYFVNFLDVFG